MPTSLKCSRLLMHAVAAICALVFAGLVSRTDYVVTGLQFTGPLAVIMAVHLVAMALPHGLSRGFASRLYARSAGTAVTMAMVIFLGSVFAPKPAQAADLGDMIGTIAVIVFCVAIIAVVAGIGALILYIFGKFVHAVADRLGVADDRDKDSRLFDIGSLAVAVALLGASTVDGIWQPLTRDGVGQAEASVLIDATPAQVWDQMNTATSPDFPLPAWLAMFPQPVAITIDEGVALGAMRQVAFEGREGSGHLTLQVTERSDTEATFTVLSDTTPYAGWVAYETLTFRIEPAANGTRVTTILTYDRGLSPAWFFAPATRGAARLAMDVLARDIKERTEG